MNISNIITTILGNLENQSNINKKLKNNQKVYLLPRQKIIAQHRHKDTCKGDRTHLWIFPVHSNAEQVPSQGKQLPLWRQRESYKRRNAQ